MQVREEGRVRVMEEGSAGGGMQLLKWVDILRLFELVDRGEQELVGARRVLLQGRQRIRPCAETLRLQDRLRDRGHARDPVVYRPLATTARPPRAHGPLQALVQP